MSEREFTPEQETQHEMSETARQAIANFQEAKLTQDPQRRRELVAAFLNDVKQLTEGVTPARPFYRAPDVQRFERMLLEQPDEGEYLPVGSGTAGQRIRFSETHPDTEESSPDTNTRWMYYIMPSESNWEYGGELWQRFVDNFGDWIVDLEQRLTKKEG